MLDMNTVKLGFIGYGNMAGATAAGLMLSGAINRSRSTRARRITASSAARQKCRGSTPLKRLFRFQRSAT